MKRLALLLTCLLLTFSLHGINKKYVYTQISQNEGLTSTVNCIYKEKDGPVWIGTPNGLYSFDGYTLNHYNDMLCDSRRVFNVCMDEDGSLWVTTDKHILKREQNNEKFEIVSTKEVPYFCAEFGKGCIWFGSKHAIYRYADNNLEAFCTFDDSFDCRNIRMADTKTLLCCSHQGKKLVDIETGSISEAPFGEASEVSATLVDSNGKIWIAFYNRGIEVFDRDGKKIKSYNTSNGLLNNNIVLCLVERGPMIIAGTDGGGINIIDPQDDAVRILTHISGNPSSFPAHSIKSLFTDNYGNIWAGSIRDGLINISQSEMNSYNDTHLGLDNGLSNPTVLCLHQDCSSDDIWIGTDGEGLNRFNPNSAKFTHYPSTFKTKTVSIADYSESELAISTYADNIWIFDKNTGSVTPLKIADKRVRDRIRHSGRSMNIYNENDGDLLLFDNEILRYDKASGICTPIKSGPQKSQSNFFILGKSRAGIWMHNNFNIYLLKDNADSLIHKGRHEHGIIRSGHLADNDLIWLATEEGLCQFDTHSCTFRHIKTSIFSDATSIICDKRSRVWVGTEQGLSAYLCESGSFALLGDSDGAKPNEYLTKPRLLASNGDIYLGGVQGLLHIGVGYAIDAAEEPQLTLNRIEVDGVKTDATRNLKIPRHSKNIGISISVKEKDMFRHRVFRFAVSDIVYETHSPFLTLNQIPRPGKYNITVSCTRKNGEWSQPYKLMTLTVPRPWYASWWFILCSIAFISLMYVLTIITINRRKSNEMKIAMQEHEQKIYEDKVHMLINISHELRTPLTLIMAPLRRILNRMTSEDINYPVISRIYRQSRRMHNLLDMVLDLRKMEVDGSHLKIENVKFNSWISDSVDDVVNEEKAEGIDIVYDFDPTVGRAELDKQKCDIVLMNILINAIKHSKCGDTITIKTAMTENCMIRISISDQGPGLAPDIDPEKMFTRFYQSNNEKYGSGIGLSYSKILVEMHGGSIGVYNNPDKGATFWWEIPLTPSSCIETEGRAYLNELLGHAEEADIVTDSEEAFDMTGMKLLLVDDNQDLLDFLREAMCNEFAEIVTTTGGHAALKVIAAEKLPDIIVSDVNMPEGDGFWLCSEIKGNERFRHIPFVLLTARGEAHSQSESYRLGADGFLAKPFEVDTLLELIRSLLRNKAEIRKRYLDSSEVAEADYGSEEERFILQLNRIIAENISNPALDQQLICRELGVSRALLYNRMKAITGAGTKEYITKIRIEKAKALIESTSLTIAEISDMTGFASQSYFSTAFKNYTGMTPSQYKTSRKDAQNATSDQGE